MAKKKKTMIYLTEQQKWQLKLQAQEKGESVAAVIREAVDQYLARERPAVDYMAIVGIIEGEPGDNTSERVDEVLAKAFLEEDIHGESEETGRAVERRKAKHPEKPRKQQESVKRRRKRASN